MASSSSSAAPSHPVIFTTQTPYALPSQKFMIPLDWKRYQLSQLINKALDLPKPIPFDFLVHGEILRTSLLEWRAEKAVGEVSEAINSSERELDVMTGRYIGDRVFRECDASSAHVRAST
ncbi:NUC135 domain-containing protein [Suillus subluteus]|nr:NUC135 domain-containing protein [Suillus subluteus]